MAQTNIETNSRLRGWLITFFIIIVIALLIWLAWTSEPVADAIILALIGLLIWLAWTPEPVVEQPKPTPCVRDEVKPEAPAELPKTGYDGE